MFSVETLIRVRYADTDQMKFVYYAKYFEYFEQGRSDLLREIGLPYSEIEKRGIYLPVIEARAEYSKPVRFDNLLKVKTILQETPESRMTISYEIANEATKKLLVTGHTVHSFVYSQSGKPTRAPEFFLNALKQRSQ